MKNKLIIGSISVLFLLLIVLVPALWVVPFAQDPGFLAMYISTKVIFGLILIGVVIFTLVKDTSFGMTSSLIGVSLFFQLFPLFVRLVSTYASSQQILYSCLILIFGLIALIGVMSAMFIMNGKMVKSEKESQAKEIKIKDNSKNFDENNKFIG